MAHVLIIEDESSIAESLIFVLQSEGFTAHWESLGNKGLDYIQQHAVDLVIMDVGLPDITGFDACKQLRRFSNIPVMFLTARGDELDRVVGLEIGADDYVVKPFSPREVAARVKVILKRMTIQSSPTALPHSESLVVSTAELEFRIDAQRKIIFYCNKALMLTKLEYSLLEQFVSHPEQVLTREQLLNAIGISADAGYDRNIDGHIKSVRAKLRLANADSEPIKTVRGFGYVYQPEPTTCR